MESVANEVAPSCHTAQHHDVEDHVAALERLPTDFPNEHVTTGTSRIGVFDSGVGGLSILRILRLRLRNASLHYVADSAHAPYGERDDAEIGERAIRLTRYLADHGAQVIVVACNSATAIAVAELRRVFDPLPVVGVEPGVKPALAATRNGRLGIMATAATLRSDKFRALLRAVDREVQVHLQPCTGLAAAVERDDLCAAELAELVEHHCAPLRAAGVDTVALGCTHYPFVRHLIQRHLGPAVQIIDTNEAVARQVERVCAGLVCASPPKSTDAAILQTTGDSDAFQKFASRWLDFPHEVSSLSREI